MADWYVSSAAYAGIAAFVPSVVYSVGQIVKPTAPALKAQWVMRCTVAGTSAASEPSWPTANNATVVSGGATFANVTGQNAYGWSAAAGDLPTLIGAVGNNRFVAGDRMFVSSDHSESQNTSTYYGTGSSGTTVSYASGQVLSVNRAGNVPPVAADLLAGATATVTAGSFLAIDTIFPVYHYGMNYIVTGALNITFNNNTSGKASYLDACQLYLNNSGAGLRINNGGAVSLTLNNTTIRFGNAGQGFGASSTPFELTWLNTPAALAGAIFPTTLFIPASLAAPFWLTARGVDLSALTGTLATDGGSGGVGSKYLFDSCRIAPGVTRYNGATVINTRDLVELVNCYNGSAFVSEVYQPSGAVTTERTITLSGGATDDVGGFSHRLVSAANIDKYVNPLAGFWMDVENPLVGASKTATVEIISSAALNNDEISLLLEYQGTAGSSVASFGNTLPGVLTAAGAVTTSTATWNSSPATPVKQQLSVIFVPQVAGRVRGQVRLGKASTTVYVNPLITVS